MKDQQGELESVGEAHVLESGDAATSSRRSSGGTCGRRPRLHDADAINDSELHSFKVLMADKANLVSDGWYWEAFEELQEQGHLHTASSLGNRGDAFARLSHAQQIEERVKARDVSSHLAR